jgi:hypothetical protein
MSTALIKKLDKVFGRLKVSERDVYKRKYTRTGGDPLIGKGASVSSADTLLVPTPVVTRPSANDPLILSGASAVPATDYLLYISPTSLSATDVKDKDTVIVFKEGSSEEECVIAAYVPIVLRGVVVTYAVLARSKKRT